MIYVKINEKCYPATIIGRIPDMDWDNRESKVITLTMDYNTASELFVDGLSWSIIQEIEQPVYMVNEDGEPVLDESGNLIPIGTETQEIEYDNSEYNIAGDLTDHRNGTITAKMGKLTDLEEAYEIMLGGI